MKKNYQFSKIDGNTELTNNVLNICWGKEGLMLDLFTDKKTLEGAYIQWKKDCEQAVRDGAIPESVGIWEEYDEETTFSNMLQIEEQEDCYYLFYQCPYEWLRC